MNLKFQNLEPSYLPVNYKVGGHIPFANATLIHLARASFMTKTMKLNGKVYKFNIWDTGGQEKVCYRAIN